MEPHSPAMSCWGWTGQVGERKHTLGARAALYCTVSDLLDGKKVVKIGGKVGSQGAASYCHGGGAQYDENGKWIPPLAAGKDGEFRQSTVASKMDESAANGQTKVAVRRVADVVRIGRTVEATRVAQSHALNHRSSRATRCSARSLYAKRPAKRGGVACSLTILRGLAGSERITMTGSESLPQDEACAINTSLSGSQRVVFSLALRELMHARFRPVRLCSPRRWGGPGCPQHGFSWIGAFRARLGRQMLSPRIV